ncbi:hypothetical protein GCM10023081_08700 [Arthrobacter ginkgonis]|uniref:SGNH hydrolase-type esterase domain-containing protein n=1 Tax=Arthrobacter ginkgonis TaxID=1630594 RepID=A0ABP7BZV6_9MICC
MDSPQSLTRTSLIDAIDEKTIGKVSKDRLAPGVKVPGGRLCYFAADSIGDGAGATNVSRAYRTVAARIAGSSYVAAVDGAVPGKRTDKINARIPAMIAPGANIIFYQGGANDASQPVPLATFQQKIIAAHKLAQDAEIPFILSTVPAVGKGSATMLAAFSPLPTTRGSSSGRRRRGSPLRTRTPPPLTPRTNVCAPTTRQPFRTALTLATQAISPLPILWLLSSGRSCPHV